MTKRRTEDHELRKRVERVEWFMFQLQGYMFQFLIAVLTILAGALVVVIAK